MYQPKFEFEVLGLWKSNANMLSIDLLCGPVFESLFYFFSCVTHGYFFLDSQGSSVLDFSKLGFRRIYLLGFN